MLYRVDMGTPWALAGCPPSISPSFPAPLPPLELPVGLLLVSSWWVSPSPGAQAQTGTPHGTRTQAATATQMLAASTPAVLWHPELTATPRKPAILFTPGVCRGLLVVPVMRAT